MEIYALQIQLYSRLKDNAKLRSVFFKSMRVHGGSIPHPRTIALIQELGGKMYMARREFEAAGPTFFQAFKSYDEAGDHPARIRCLRYLVMASMLHASSINPFDSQEARPYREDPDVVAMTKLVQAFHDNDISTFERILSRNEGKIMNDEFLREYIGDLLKTIRSQVLLKVIGPYEKIKLSSIAKNFLNGIDTKDVEALLVDLILEGKVNGKIDQVEGILEKQNKTEGGMDLQRYDALDQITLALKRLSSSTSSIRL
jgi:COP9 signalosome complex subunit 2